MTMGVLLSYTIQSTIVMTVLYLVYKWLLSAETFHAFNRGVILAIYIVSLVAPVAIPSIGEIFRHQTAAVAYPSALLPFAVTVIDTPEPDVPLWLSALLCLYLAGIIVMTARLIITGINIVRIIHGGDKIQTPAYTIVISGNKEIAPFSW